MAIIYPPKKFDSVRERLIQYVRYQKQNKRVALEFSLGCDSFYADLVSSYPNGYTTEYEIKKSWPDFLGDFKKESGGTKKHERVARGEFANYFYFVVPDFAGIHKKINDYLRYNHAKYGVIVVNRHWVKVERPARRLHENIRDWELGDGTSVASLARKVIELEGKLKDIKDEESKKNKEQLEGFPEL